MFLHVVAPLCPMASGSSNELGIHRQMQEDRESYKNRFYGLDLYMVLISAGEARTCSLAVGLEEKGS